MMCKALVFLDKCVRLCPLHVVLFLFLSIFQSLYANASSPTTEQELHDFLDENVFGRINRHWIDELEDEYYELRKAYLAKRGEKSRKSKNDLDWLPVFFPSEETTYEPLIEKLKDLKRTSERRVWDREARKLLYDVFAFFGAELSLIVPGIDIQLFPRIPPELQKTERDGGRTDFSFLLIDSLAERRVFVSMVIRIYINLPRVLRESRTYDQALGWLHSLILHERRHVMMKQFLLQSASKAENYEVRLEPFDDEKAYELDKDKAVRTVKRMQKFVKPEYQYLDSLEELMAYARDVPYLNYVGLSVHGERSLSGDTSHSVNEAKKFLRQGGYFLNDEKWAEGVGYLMRALDIAINSPIHPRAAARDGDVVKRMHELIWEIAAASSPSSSSTSQM